MQNNTLLSVRSNCNFSLNYETGKLHPQAEVILIASTPKYVVNKKKDGVSKEMDIHELRFHAGIDGVNKLIGELQLLIKNMNAFDQSAAMFNTIIQSMKEKEESQENAS